jgi:hypothetical protein
MKNMIASSLFAVALALSVDVLAGDEEEKQPVASPAQRQAESPAQRQAERQTERPVQRSVERPVERQASPRPPAHNPEWTHTTTGDPGRDSVAGELQTIVVLCAKDHDSPEFKRAWSAYVRKHNLAGPKLDQTIQRVVNEAHRHRQSSGQSDGSRLQSPRWKTEASRSMHDTSKAAINNTKG